MPSVSRSVSNWSWATAWFSMIHKLRTHTCDQRKRTGGQQVCLQYPTHEQKVHVGEHVLPLPFLRSSKRHHQPLVLGIPPNRRLEGSAVPRETQPTRGTDGGQKARTSCCPSRFERKKKMASLPPHGPKHRRVSSRPPGVCFSHAVLDTSILHVTRETDEEMTWHETIAHSER